MKLRCNTSMALKLTAILGMFEVARHLVEKAPEIVERVLSAETAGHAPATAVSVGLIPTLLPLAVVASALIETAAKRYEGRPEPEALLELFRESLLEALCECKPSLVNRPEVTESDNAVLNLWLDGLNQSAGRPGFWQQLLDDTVPDATVRMLSVEPGRAPSWWPTLRVVLTRWTSFLRADLSPGSLGLNLHETALDLSPWTEAFLRVNLTALFFKEFSARLTSGNQGPAFRQTSLALLTDLGARLASIRDACTPIEPLKTLTEFPTAASIRRDTQLLNAQYRAFPYIGRENEIDKLLAWLDGPEAASFFVIAGGAGDGKTRLGFQLLERLEVERPHVWRAGWLGSRRAEDALRNERFRRWRGAQPTLILIDYAASFTEILRDNVVRELAEEVTDAIPDLPPLRILLFEREAEENRGWYNALHREARDRAPDLFPHPVLRLSKLGDEERRQLFARVLESAYGLDAKRRVPARPAIEIPDATRFSGDNFRHPLAVCMAALVAYQRGNLTSLNLNRLDLAREMANHEYGRVERAARTNRKHPFLLLHLSAYITCTGGLTEDQMRDACREEKAKIEPDSQWSVAELLTVITTLALPPEDHSFAAEPIQPDIVGEAFIVRVLRHNVGHAVATETFLRAFAMRPRFTTRTLVRMVQDFAMTPDRSDDGALAIEAETDKNWALSMLTAILSAKAQSLRDEDFWEVYKVLKLDTTEMAQSCRDFFRAVHKSRQANDDIGIAALEQDCWNSISLGNITVANEGAIRVVNYRRASAGVDPQRIADLADSLWLLSACQDRLILHKEALGSAGEASRLLLDLKKDKPASIELDPGISRCLNTLATTQLELGQIGAAIESGAEALRLRRTLVSSDPDQFLPALAESQVLQAQILRKVGDRVRPLATLIAAHDDSIGVTPALDQAAALIADAVGLLRELAESNPDAHLHRYANALLTQGGIQRDLGQPQTGFSAVTEAVKHLEKLVSATRGGQRLQLLRDLSNTLDNKASLQRELDDHAGALCSISAATEHWRELVCTDEVAYLRDLAMSLRHQYLLQRDAVDIASRDTAAAIKSNMNLLDDALKSISEAVKHFSTIEQRIPGSCVTELSDALNKQARTKWEAGDRPAAMESAREAIRICDKPSSAKADVLSLHRAWALGNLAVMQSQSGATESALTTFEEAIRCYRAAQAAGPGQGESDSFAVALNNMAVSQLTAGRRSEAIESISEATGEFGRLANANPSKFLRELARSLDFWGETLLEDQQPVEAAAKLESSLRYMSLLRGVEHRALHVAKLYEQACAEADVRPSPDLNDFLQWLKQPRAGQRPERSGEEIA